MQTLTEKLLQAGCAGRVLTLAQLSRRLEGTPQRRYGLVNRALRHGELLQLRRGLYLQPPLPHPFVLSQALLPGSYISFESALSFHGWIPELVPNALGVSPAGRAVEVNHVLLGLFRFYPLALNKGFGLEAVNRHTFAGQSALVAEPERALLDIVCHRKLDLNSVKSLAESMRIDRHLLGGTDGRVWQTLNRVYKHQRMASAIDALHLEGLA